MFYSFGEGVSKQRNYIFFAFLKNASFIYVEIPLKMNSFLVHSPTEAWINYRTAIQLRIGQFQNKLQEPEFLHCMWINYF